MNREELKSIIPHREHMLLIDEASVIDGTAVGSYTIRGDEFFLQGHFPGNPVVPGAILCEMIAQASCVLICGMSSSDTPYFCGMDKVRFKNKVRIGDRVEFKCTSTRQKAHFYFITGEGYVDGKLCVSGDFSFAVFKGEK